MCPGPRLLPAGLRWTQRLVPRRREQRLLQRPRLFRRAVQTAQHRSVRSRRRGLPARHLLQRALLQQPQRLLRGAADGLQSALRQLHHLFAVLHLHRALLQQRHLRLRHGLPHHGPELLRRSGLLRRSHLHQRELPAVFHLPHLGRDLLFREPLLQRPHLQRRHLPGADELPEQRSDLRRRYPMLQPARLHQRRLPGRAHLRLGGHGLLQRERVLQHGTFLPRGLGHLGQLLRDGLCS